VIKDKKEKEKSKKVSEQQQRQKEKSKRTEERDRKRNRNSSRKMRRIFWLLPKGTFPIIEVCHDLSYKTFKAVIKSVE
jgi:hypothetical protein